MPNKERILITGGHVTTALAVIEEIERQKKPWEIIFIGRKSALEGSAEVSQEYRLITARGIRFIPLLTGRLQRGMTVLGILSFLKIPLGFMQALWLVAKLQPKLIVSFGGYLALPVAVAGFLLDVDIVTHEQTKIFGLTNRLIGRLCRRIFVSYPELLEKLPKDKAVFTGLPIRHGLFQPPAQPSFRYDRKPLIYITGGATGAKSLNELIFPLVAKLTQQYMLVHQTGGPSLERAKRVQAALPASQRHSYLVASYFALPDVAWIYKKALAVIGRSGGNTVAEIALLGKVALFIPLPWSAEQEQQKNALVLVQAGSALVVDQKKVDSARLERILSEFLAKNAAYQAAAKVYARGLRHDGAARIVAELAPLIMP